MILGFDLGGNFGYAVLSRDGGLVDSGTWKLGKRCGKSLYTCYNNLLELFLCYDIECVGYEKVYGQPNRNGIYAAQAYGGYEALLLIATYDHDVKYIEHVPVQSIKKIATNNGRAEKEDVMDAVVIKWGHLPKGSDEADAIWCAEYVRSKFFG